MRVELLTGPIEAPELLEKVRIKRPRVRPRKGEVELHAYLTAEAVAPEVDPVSVPLVEDCSVRIPNAFSFLVMKLHACHDRIFADLTSLGVLRMREHALADDSMQVERAIELLHDLFPTEH